VKFVLTDDRSRATQHNQVRSKSRRAKRCEPSIFHAVDGEGQMINGRHEYVLLSVGAESISNPGGLSWDQIFSFLWDQFTALPAGKHVFSGFYLGYDFTEWLRSLPEDRARMLFTDRGKAQRVRTTRSVDGDTHFPVFANNWEFDLLANKRFKIRWIGSEEWMYVCDSGPFFQSTFLTAINPEKWDEPVCTTTEYDEIVEGKSDRSSAVLGPRMVAYNLTENRVHERLMARYEQGLIALEIGLTPRQWFGPGQVAQTWMSQRRRIPTAKQLKEKVPDWYLDAARKSYIGGWFELFAHGHIPGRSHEYDINSAYPHIIAGLPCLLHGTYSHGSGRPGQHTGSLQLVRATVHGNTEGQPRHPIGSMLHRTRTGSILRPTRTTGWFWIHELQAAQRAGCIETIEYHEWQQYEPCGCPPPLAEVAELYDFRKKVNKKSALGRAIKILINSIYGKFAQSVGTPKYGNAIYASLITAGCRTMILDAIATHPGGMSNVLMVATDGVYFLDAHPGLPISSDLGDWDHAVHDNLCLYKPGVYWDDKTRSDIAAGDRPVFKARGISADDFAASIARVDRRFTRWPKRVQGDLTSRESFTWPTVEYRGRFSLTSCSQALARGKWATAGDVAQDVKLVQNSDAWKKREGLFYDTSRKIYRSLPWEPGQWFDQECTPYEKRFGVEDPWSIESLEEYGITPDGALKDLITETMMRHE
jgi:DNA polymerase type B, organellar and viral